ncbi:MAG: hypothetical protein OEV78_06920 [Spirochaetia bacterium]|nr:hypothetical protein [Spirochaetia bacterium]
MKTIWIIAADKKEIPGIDLILNKNSAKYNLKFYTCGIGLFESFYVFTTLLNQTSQVHQPDGILLAGTSGSPNAEDIFKLNLTNRFLNPQFNVEELPEFLPVEWITKDIDDFTGDIGNHPYNRLNLTIDFLNTPVYSTFGISKTVHHLTPAMSGAWENMEALSLSYICMKRQIPFIALLCCTNQICPDGRKQWKQNYIKAGEILFKALNNLFKI